MLEIPILKDIREYETKLVGPFTTRKLLCTIVAAGFGYASYAAQIYLIGMSKPLFPIIFTAAAIPLLFATKPYGLKFEVFLKTAFFCNYVCPKNRIFKTFNVYDKIIKEAEILNLKENKKKVKKKKIKNHKSKEFPAYK